MGLFSFYAVSRCQGDVVISQFRMLRVENNPIAGDCGMKPRCYWSVFSIV